mgnify:CR=1 FL=1
MTNHPLSSQPKSQKTGKEAENTLPLTTWQRISKVFGWPFWTALVMVSFSATGYVATATLLSLNTPKGCESVYWPLASGARRLYCAQVEVKEGDAESYLAAINLVSELPEDHPLRKEINKNIKVWSEQVLVLGEKQFQAGNLEAAMAIAEKIPSGVAAKAVVEEKVRRWRDIWQQGEAIEQDVEAQLNQAAWNQAFKEAGRLVDLKNDYLANRRYTELITKIQKAKVEGAVLDEARNAFDKGSVEDLLTAIEKAQSIKESSYSYQAAQNLITKVGETLMAKAQENLDQRNWNTVLDIAQAIPDRLNLQEEVRDLRAISLAGLQAQQGTVSGLQEAISQAEQLEAERPLYTEAQALIERWNKEIDDVKVIAEAKQYANGGRISDLRAGMVKAEEVPRGNPRYSEARQLINQWNRKIQIIEDRPIINRAESFARGRSIRDYQSAIALASEISPNRALYREAQRKIGSWQNQIERIEDRPILSQASNLASQGRLESAIETAQQISSNRALYREAQTNIRRWRSELKARNSIQEASNLAESGTLEALSQAI